MEDPAPDRGGASRGYPPPSPPPPCPPRHPGLEAAGLRSWPRLRAGRARHPESPGVRRCSGRRPPQQRLPSCVAALSPRSRHPSPAERRAQVASAGEETCLPPEWSPRREGGGGVPDAQVPLGKGRRGRGLWVVAPSEACLRSCPLLPFPPRPNSHGGTLGQVWPREGRSAPPPT